MDKQYKIETWPKGVELEKKIISISSFLFGNRFKLDQTIYEYMIEFLLVFSSAKSEDITNENRMSFHNLNDSSYCYYPEPRMGLRRFIFFDKSKKQGSIDADNDAYKDMLNLLMNKFDSVEDSKKEEFIEDIQDLFYGYAVIIKKRFWGAQALLPICPEFLFCGCDPSVKKRNENVDFIDNPVSVDTKFSFDKRNFLSRGGELYYLHLLQGLEGKQEKKLKLEILLRNLLTKQCSKISKMASFIQNCWESHLVNDSCIPKQKLKISFIPKDAYTLVEDFSVDELINYLSCKMHPIKKIEILAKGIMLQILRMMSSRISSYLKEQSIWIIDMNGNSNDSFKKIASDSYSKLESNFMTAINKMASEINESETKEIIEAKKNTFDIFRSKGKEMNFIIPKNGRFERFCLTEDILRFLVPALIPPSEKMTLNMFLEKLYKHYGIVIGPKEYQDAYYSCDNQNTSLLEYFTENVFAFQNFLKKIGFLKELSDATSLVINPYQKINISGKE